MIENLTFDEKIGQLFMVIAYSNKSKEHKKEISRLIKKHKIGGLMFLQGGPKDKQFSQIIINLSQKFH